MRVADLIRKSGRGLYGLVNNAGIGTVGSVADMKAGGVRSVDGGQSLRGPYRMTRAVEPLIIAAKGRIINIGSIFRDWFFSSNLMAYSMSKHALEAFSESLVLQLKEIGGHGPASSNRVTTIQISARARSSELALIAAALRDKGYRLTADRLAVQGARRGGRCGREGTVSNRTRSTATW